ncbi:putative acetoacetyl-CoA synthetase [Gemmatimonas aurantiaca T-27]|uniref:Putative acetoacetyl-CoA synthetase n=1 Tax=Gemmatimonas aurantiaca (strain DSM 14586 / JCM 11422 / NBRC 100505 / T-27) TaxID=379066 RepID=C1A9J1_GEMAT|nr:acetoacetate--CoA ligase [Gemmatimonas aurantiaca]BAH39168.1 putative acetoacetyl-CoA synthetase [Gemmatimonas aurantiaca T-27]
MTDSLPLWTPSADAVAATRLQQFLQDLTQREVVPAAVRDAHALQRWSVEHPERFWQEVWRAADIMADGPGPADAPWREVLVGGDRMAPPDPVLGPRWFTEARLNFAEHLLRRRDDGLAIVAWNEQGAQQRLTFAELATRVAQCAAALAAQGVGVGDRVAGWMPNLPETVIAMLATASLGAVWSSCSPDFGTKGVLDRFGQITPTVLIAADGYRYAGKRIDCLPRLAEIAAAIPSLRAVWVVPYLETTPDVSGVAGAQTFDQVLAAHAAAQEPSFVRLPFDHPLYVMYSSGTTGLPKCMVHGAGGTLLQHWKELALHTDLHADDVLFYFTTCGWMMWNWLVSGLALGATVVLYDGAPLAPDPAILWRMAEAERVSVFGTSAKYLAVLEKEGVTPRTSVKLGALRSILSTGSPLAEHSYDFVYRDISPSIRLCSISGGTDIVSCFALGDPTGAVYRGELQMRGLGMSVDVWNDEGQPVTQEPGELVCTKPFPSMPVAFWNDPDGAVYRAAYFEHFPGVWRHGDWVELTAHDGLIIHGRSDATLNPGGVRIGTAEIYRQVEQIPEVLESLVVEQRYQSADGPDSRVVLFVRLREGQVLDASLQQAIGRRIREHTSPHHVPRVIVSVPDIPRTISGKITELAVRETIHGRPVKNQDALANPESLAYFRDRPELAVS